MRRVISYLRDLKAHNEREWFNAHKDAYLEAQSVFNGYVQSLIGRMAETDGTLGGLQAKDCVFRIYRDVRFSKDKSPYKTHMGAYICRGGKKSGYSGYYFHVGIGGHGYPDGHMLAVGDYCCDAKVLKILREDIQDDGLTFHNYLVEAAKVGFVLDDSWKLKKVPAGFDKESEWAEFLKYKVYCLWQEPAEDLFLGDDSVERVAQTMLTAKPFLDFVNRAIEYVKEGNE